MKYLIVANWKCNPLTQNEAEDIFRQTSEKIEGAKNVETVICPPFIYLLGLTTGSPAIKLGAQDCYFEEKGAFTGEISPEMLKGIGCQYVIVGHSERRKYQNENDETVNQKIKAILRAGLYPILCIDNEEQVKKGTQGLSENDLEKTSVAFEPIWAIGTGKACGVSEAKEMALSVRKILGDKVAVLYGGSVTAANAKGYIEEGGFNGLLVGGASLKPEEFSEIIKGVDSI